MGKATVWEELTVSVKRLGEDADRERARARLQALAGSIAARLAGAGEERTSAGTNLEYK